MTRLTYLEVKLSWTPGLEDPGLPCREIVIISLHVSDNLFDEEDLK